MKTTGWILTRTQTTSRPDTLWPETWKNVSGASKRNEKQKWAIEKPKLDNSRKLRGIYFIDTDDEEFKNIMKKSRRKLEIPMPAAMSCKLQRDKYRKLVAQLKNTRQNAFVLLKSMNQGSLHKYHEDHIAGKGMNSLSHSNLVHKFIPMP